MPQTVITRTGLYSVLEKLIDVGSEDFPSNIAFSPERRICLFKTVHFHTGKEVSDVFSAKDDSMSTAEIEPNIRRSQLADSPAG